jgi:putative ABC transport system permease protein
MMINYFKQAWNLLRQEKLFSSIYILGTGLSITVVMVLAVVFYIKIANIYPETNRDRMLIVKGGTEVFEEDGGMQNAPLSLSFIETCLYPLESAEAVSAVMASSGVNYVQPEDDNLRQWQVEVQFVDTAYWKVFSFHFIDGKPFTASDFESGIQTAVIAESLAKRLFGTVEATGRQVNLNFKPYRICGVVQDVSLATERTFAQLWVPYTVNGDYNTDWGMRASSSRMTGPMVAYILAPSVHDLERVKEEVTANFNRFAGQFDKVKITLNGQPDRHWQSTFRPLWSGSIDFNQIALQYISLFLILLIVPAISLSGMADSRMERRLAEMGVRRAFGAPKSSLTGQIISENLVFTLLGGGLGLLLSYLLILLGRSWILNIDMQPSYMPIPRGDVILTPSMLLNFPVFGMALGVCFLLNLFSAFIPAWKASHQPIVHSLNT